MDGLKKLSELKTTQEERNKALTDALEIKNPLLIQIALAMGANPLEGGGKLLVYASEQGNLGLVKKLVPTIDLGSDAGKKYIEEATIKATLRGHKEIIKEMFPDALPVAMKAAVDNELFEMTTWLLSKGAVLRIDKECVKCHFGTLKNLLCSNSKVRTDIEESALSEVLSIDNSSEVLKMLLNTVKRDEPEHFNKWLISLAEECVETDRIDCMEVILQFGVNIKGVSTRYCQSGVMREFMRANGAHIWEY